MRVIQMAVNIQRMYIALIIAMILTVLLKLLKIV